jgi:hypothetical protein
MFAAGSAGHIRTMEIRRPLAAFLTALALFGGGATLTACEASGQDQNDGTTDDSHNTGGNTQNDTDQGDDSQNGNGTGQEDVNN